MILSTVSLCKKLTVFQCKCLYNYNCKQGWLSIILVQFLPKCLYKCKYYMLLETCVTKWNSCLFKWVNYFCTEKAGHDLNSPCTHSTLLVNSAEIKQSSIPNSLWDVPSGTSGFIHHLELDICSDECNYHDSL